jgi:hypothetical protein
MQKSIKLLEFWKNELSYHKQLFEKRTQIKKIIEQRCFEITNEI